MSQKSKMKILELEQRDEWDKIVRSFNDYDVYWLSGYVKAFEIHGDGKPLLFFYEDDESRGINVVMLRDIANDSRFVEKIPQKTYWDISTPYGYGGWIIEGKIKEELFIEYTRKCIEFGIICEFVRFHPMLENVKFCKNEYRVVELGNTVALDLESPETIWANITSKNRNMIRKAQKNNVKIYNARNPQIYSIFKKIYNETMDKDNADEFYYFTDEFYKSILEDLPQNAQVFYALYEEKIIAASIMLASNGKMNYHLSGSMREYSHLAPTNLLLYEAAIWGYTNGYKTLYLGGGVGSEEDSLYKFKKSFYRKDDVKKFFIGKKIFDEEKYKILCELVDKNDINNLYDGYFPKYRS